MNKTEAAQILNVNVTDNAAQIEARYLQVTAFFSIDADSTVTLKGLADKARAEFEQAYLLLPKSNNQTSQHIEPLPVEKDVTPKSSTLKSLIVPLPLESAGEPLSSQWWKVYQRAVILFFLTVALCFDQAPRVLSLIQKPPERYIPPVITTPTENPSTSNDSPFGEVGPPPDSSTSIPGTLLTPPTGLTQNTTLTPDPSLNPTPNSNPLTITPTQSPQSFLIGLFWAIKEGNNTQSMISGSATQAVSQMLMRNHTLTPRLQDLSQDQMKVISQLGGTATVRVDETYFTGFQEINDYYLVSDNGIWKLSDIRRVAGGMH